MDGLQVRDARPADRDAIEGVTLAAYQQYAALMPVYWDAYRENILATLAAVHPAAQIVAELDGIIVGTVLLYPPGSVIANTGGATITPTAPEVRLLAVEPSARGRGIAEVLMHECIRRSRAAGAGSLTLHTARIMQAAMRLYQRLGFQRAPELDFQVGPGATVEGYRLEL